MSRNKTLVSLSRYPVIPLSRLNRHTGTPAHRHTGTPAHRHTVLLLCFLFLYSILFAQEKFVYDSKNKRNPFIPLVTPDGMLLKLEQEEATTGSLLLEGIIYDKHGLSYAIVNGEVKRIGDKVSDYQVLRIEKDKVIFIKEGQTIEVKLKESNEEETYGTK